jgi:acyl-CoA thioester hydrolase
VRELRDGDPLRITTQILDFDDKRLHLFHTMYHADAGYRAATNELLMMHVDYASRRAAPWPEETLRRLRAMAAAHRDLPRPAEAGRPIALRRTGG